MREGQDEAWGKGAVEDSWQRNARALEPGVPKTKREDSMLRQMVGAARRANGGWVWKPEEKVLPWHRVWFTTTSSLGMDAWGPKAGTNSFGIGLGEGPVRPAQVFADLQWWGHNWRDQRPGEASPGLIVR